MTGVSEIIFDRDEQTSSRTSSKGRLCGLRHHIRLVQDDQLEALPGRKLSKRIGRRAAHENKTLVMAKLLI
jgi:putative lipoic acid-binding regulatory protein